MNRQFSLFAQQPQSVDDLEGSTPLSATFDLFADFLRGEGKTEHTVKAFIGDLRLLAEFTGSALPTGDLHTSRLVDFLRWMERDRGLPCSRKTYARRVTSLKVYCKWLYANDVLAEDPAQPLRQRSGPAPLSHVLTDKQVSDCLFAASQTPPGRPHDARPPFLFRLLLETGIKKAECGRLQLRDFDRGNQACAVLYVRQSTRNVYKERRIILAAETLPLLDRYLRQYQVEEKLFDCTTRNLEYILTDIGARANTPFKLSFEVMRWTMAVRDYLAGVEEVRIREKLGLSRQSWYETGDKVRRLAASLPTISGTSRRNMNRLLDLRSKQKRKSTVVKVVEGHLPIQFNCCTGEPAARPLLNCLGSLHSALSQLARN